MSANPIVLNQYGEKLRFDTSFRVEENMRLEDVALEHGCGESASLTSVSDTHRSIFCSSHGRIPDPAYIPREVITIAELRQWCADEIARKKEWELKLAIMWGLTPAGKYDAMANAKRYRSGAVEKLSPTSAEIIAAANEERRRIRKIIGDQ